MKKILVILLSLVMLLCFFSACGSKSENEQTADEPAAAVSTYKTPIELALKKMAGIITKSEFEASYPGEYWQANNLDDAWAKYEDTKEEAAQKYGENATYSIEITAREEQSAEVLDKIGAKLHILYGIERSDVAAAYKLSYTYRVGGSILEHTGSEESVTVVQIRDQWYKYPF